MANDDDGDPLEGFVRELTVAQPRLRAYLLATLGNAEDAGEVHQRTNLALWRNAAAFRLGADFMPWAITIAKYEVLSFYRDQSRDRHVFVEDVALLMLDTASKGVERLEERQEALRQCVTQLEEPSQAILRLRYEDEKSIAEIAESTKRTADAIKSALLRIRKALERCVTLRLRQTMQA